MLYATGNQNSGLSLFIQSERLVFDYNCFGEHHVIESDTDVPAGESVVGVRFRGSAAGRGSATLVIDGTGCGTVDIPFVMLILSSIGPSVGLDHGSPVSRRYASPFAFEDTLDRVDIRNRHAKAAVASGIAAGVALAHWWHPVTLLLGHLIRLRTAPFSRPCAASK